MSLETQNPEQPAQGAPEVQPIQTAETAAQPIAPSIDEQIKELQVNVKYLESCIQELERKTFDAINELHSIIFKGLPAPESAGLTPDTIQDAPKEEPQETGGHGTYQKGQFQ